MRYYLENGYVYREIGTVVQLIGDVNKVETQRIDASNVADVSYTFDFNQNKYIETGRVERSDPLPPNEIEQLKAQNAEIILALVLNDLM